MAVELTEVVPWGRSFGEYVRMFALGEGELRGRILGCGDGPASFNTEGTGKGVRIVSCDPIYGFSGEEIGRRVEACAADMVRQVWREKDGFVWKVFVDPDDLGRHRLEVMREFLTDYEVGLAEGRYVVGALPALPFEEAAFDLAVVSHFLFLYAGRLDVEFHWMSVVELMRVAREVRIFPLVTLARERCEFVEPIVERCLARGWRAEVVRVGYEFVKGGDEMLVIGNG